MQNKRVLNLKGTDLEKPLVKLIADNFNEISTEIMFLADQPDCIFLYLDPQSTSPLLNIPRLEKIYKVLKPTIIAIKVRSVLLN